MESSKMSARLEAVASMVPRDSRVADIGTDHAILPRRLLSSGRAAHCIASDVKADCLKDARGFPPGCLIYQLRNG